MNFFVLRPLKCLNITNFCYLGAKSRQPDDDLRFKVITIFDRQDSSRSQYYCFFHYFLLIIEEIFRVFECCFKFLSGYHWSFPRFLTLLLMILFLILFLWMLHRLFLGVFLRTPLSCSEFHSVP